MKVLKFYKVIGFIRKANSKELSFFEFINALFLVFTHWTKEQYRPRKRNILIGALVILYLISPLDFLPGLFFDDLTLLFFAYKYFKKEALRFLDWRKKYQTENLSLLSQNLFRQ